MGHKTDNHENKESMDFDDILPDIGEFGKYQKLIIWLICLPACFPSGICGFNQIFMANVPDHWCHVPELQNFTVEERKLLSIPKVDNAFSKCNRYAVNFSALLESSENPDKFSSQSWPTEKCLDGWEFNKSDIYSSIVIDFNLVCDKEIYPTLGLVALNLGSPFGVLCFGALNDRIGRKKTYFICLFTIIFGGIITTVAPSFWWWSLSRFIVGLSFPAIGQIPYIIGLELVGPDYRSLVTLLMNIFYTVGLIMLSGITYMIRDWVYINLATTLPFLLYFLYWFYLPESPRWLLARGKFEEASAVLETLAKANNKELPPRFKHKLKENMMKKRSASEEKMFRKNLGLTDLCGTPNMRLKSILITLNWFANNMVYVGLSYYGPSLGSNAYVSFLLSSAIELPSYVGSWLLIDKWGRRWPLCVCMLLSGISCMATVLVPSDDKLLTLILFLISKSTISASFFIIYPFAGELYPTAVRGLGMGTSSYIAGMGIIITPFITYLGTELLVLPIIILGMVCIVGGLSGLRLPETLHQPLPQTLEEGEAFGKDFTWSDIMRCVPVRPSSSTSSS